VECLCSALTAVDGDVPHRPQVGGRVGEPQYVVSNTGSTSSSRPHTDR
jgi:hypothetical protein